MRQSPQQRTTREGDSQLAQGVAGLDGHGQRACFQESGPGVPGSRRWDGRDVGAAGSSLAAPALEAPRPPSRTTAAQAFSWSGDPEAKSPVTSARPSSKAARATAIAVT